MYKERERRERLTFSNQTLTAVTYPSTAKFTGGSPGHRHLAFCFIYIANFICAVIHTDISTLLCKKQSKTKKLFQVAPIL